MYDRVFSGRYLDRGCFRDEDWAQVLLPTHRFASMDPAVFTALQQAVDAAEDGNAVVMTEVEGPFEESVSLGFDRCQLDKAWGEGAFDALDSVVYGASASWGLFVAYDDVTCVGGTGAFMRQFLDGVPGGREKLKKDFFDHAEWCVDPLVKEGILGRVGWA